MSHQRPDQQRSGPHLHDPRIQILRRQSGEDKDLDQPILWNISDG